MPRPAEPTARPPWVPQVPTDERVVRTERGVLLRSVQRADAGLYLCHATEHGFTQPLLRLSLEVIGARQAAGKAAAGDPQLAAGPPGRKVWYRDFLQLVERPPLGAADRGCQRLWSRGRPPPPPPRPRRSPRPRAGRGAPQSPPPAHPRGTAGRAGPPQRVPLVTAGPAPGAGLCLGAGSRAGGGGCGSGARRAAGLTAPPPPPPLR